MDAAGRRLNITPARILCLAEHYGIKTGQRGGQRFARYPSGACLLQFSLEGERHYLHLGTAGERVLLSHEWAERDETRRIKSRYEVIPVSHTSCCRSWDLLKEERTMVRKYKGTREEYEQKLGGRGE